MYGSKQSCTRVKTKQSLNQIISIFRKWVQVVKVFVWPFVTHIIPQARGCGSSGMWNWVRTVIPYEKREQRNWQTCHCLLHSNEGRRMEGRREPGENNDGAEGWRLRSERAAEEEWEEKERDQSESGNRGRMRTWKRTEGEKQWKRLID